MIYIAPYRPSSITGYRGANKKNRNNVARSQYSCMGILLRNPTETRKKTVNTDDCVLLLY